MSNHGSDQRWAPQEPSAGTKSTMTVLVPDPTHTLEPFGFSRALLDPTEPDAWDDHAAALVGEATR